MNSFARSALSLQVNAYFATLIVAVVGAAAVFTIMHVANEVGDSMELLSNTYELSGSSSR